MVTEEIPLKEEHSSIKEFTATDQTFKEIMEKSVGPEIKKIDRVPSGIPGLDELIEGGFVQNSVIMVAGESGTGKTIFCTQFIWNALCIGDNGVYVTLQQTADEVRDDVAMFGRDFRRAEELNQCRIIFIEPQDIKKIIQIILKNVKEIKAKRLAIDSISMICEYAEKRRDIRYNLGYLLRQLKKMGVTTVISSEVEEGSNLLSRYGIEEFLVDGVIVLKCGVDVVGGKPRSLYIKKMRRTKHDLNTHPFEITERGIRIIE
ncbi:MAG: gas vesicle protein GvpD [Candidatus Aenigmarchaeota archaeon]|nr:gas vesicle protein GvpD [Candidatus Aenigmarchaeota archaeon]